MSNLKNIVPPVELCKQIPAGEFEDSALFWKPFEDRDGWCVLIRIGLKFNNKRNDYLVPAPTLEEILDALGNLGASFCANGMQIDNQFYEYPTSAEEALRLWFKVKGIEV